MRYLAPIMLLLSFTTVAQAAGSDPFFPARPAVLPVRADTLQAARSERIVPRAAKHSGLAFLFSLILPGSGELYAGAPKRAAIFFSIEALTWINYARWHSNGNDLVTKFRAFANEHWNEARYRQWQAYNAAQPASQQYFEGEVLLPVQQNAEEHYEVIGKYDQFVFGWDDITVPFTTDLKSLEKASPRRLSYEQQRNASNKDLKRAGVALGVVVFNHIISAIHASVVTRIKGEKARNHAHRLSIRLSSFDETGRFVPAATLNARF